MMMRDRLFFRPLTLATMLGAVAIAGCSRQEPEPDATELENVGEGNRAELMPPPMEALPPMNMAEPPANAVVEAPPPAEEPSVDQQMLDDADAVGMTARLPPPVEDAPAGNATEGVVQQ